ncbi:hypothetical protein P3L10_018834 [Capsicum annuum]
MNNFDREWMYDRLLEDEFINSKFIYGVESFIEFAKSRLEFMDGEKLRCPCNYHPRVLDNHQEKASSSGETMNSQSHNDFRAIVFDIARPFYDGNIEEDPNPTTQNLYNLLKASK